MNKIKNCINNMNLKFFNLFLQMKNIIKYDDIIFEFIGSGGEGIIYKVMKYAIKIYKTNTKLSFNREIEIMKMTNNLLEKNVSINFLKLHDSFTKFNHTVIIMDLVDGSLEDWYKEKHSDSEWIVILFQILYNILVMQKCLKMYHSDMKPKNILFKKLNNFINIKFIIKEHNEEKVSFILKTNYIIYISDFGHSLSLLFKDDEKSSDIIKECITNNYDLIHIKTLYNRLLVDILQNKYTIDDLLKTKNDKMKDYFLSEQERINTEMKKYPQHIKNKMLLRSVIYYLLNNNLINIDEYKDILPSENIKTIIEELTNETQIIDMIKKILIVDWKSHVSNKVDKIVCINL